VRAACPGGPLDVSTGAWIEADYGCRVDLVGAWGSLLPVEDRPDFAGGTSPRMAPSRGAPS
jgi:hypothetical protein